MKSYLMVETRDPHEIRDVDWTCDVARALSRKAQVALFLAENGVFGARQGCGENLVRKLNGQGVAVVADRYALAERGIDVRDLADGVRVADIDYLADALMSGVCVAWR